MCSELPGARACNQLEDRNHCFGQGACCIHERLYENQPYCICQADWSGKRCDVSKLEDYDSDATPTDHMRATMPTIAVVVVVCLITVVLFVKFVRGHTVHHCRRSRQLNGRQRYMMIYAIPDSVQSAQSPESAAVTSLLTDCTRDLNVGAVTSYSQQTLPQCLSRLLPPLPSKNITSSSSTTPSTPTVVMLSDGAVCSRDATMTTHCYDDVRCCESTKNTIVDVIL